MVKKMLRSKGLSSFETLVGRKVRKQEQSAVLAERFYVENNGSVRVMNVFIIGATTFRVLPSKHGGPPRNVVLYPTSRLFKTRKEAVNSLKPRDGWVLHRTTQKLEKVRMVPCRDGEKGFHVIDPETGQRSWKKGFKSLAVAVKDARLPFSNDCNDKLKSLKAAVKVLAKFDRRFGKYLK